MYQRKRLSTGEDVGEPGPLPVNLRGRSDGVLADLAALGPDDTGYFPVVPKPEPVRWLHEAIYLRRSTAAERIAIKAKRAESQAWTTTCTCWRPRRTCSWTILT
jgi:hypothetical protein